jgi:hypothetical protein
MRNRNPERQQKDGRPPFGAWWRFYALVVIWLALLIVFFYLFTRHYS